MIWSGRKLVGAMPSRSILGSLALLAGIALAAHYGTAELAARGRLGIDLQAHPCLPWRVYLLKPLEGNPDRGDIIEFTTQKLRPATSNPGVKRLDGLPGDLITVKDLVLYINGRQHVKLAVCLSSYRPEYCADRSYTIQSDQYLVFGDDESSFDSRYWGVIDRSDIVGKAHPLL